VPALPATILALCLGVLGSAGVLWPKLIATAVVAGSLLLVAAVVWWWRDRLRPDPLLTRLFVVLALWSALSTLWAPEPVLALKWSLALTLTGLLPWLLLLTQPVAQALAGRRRHWLLLGAAVVLALLLISGERAFDFPLYRLAHGISLERWAAVEFDKQAVQSKPMALFLLLVWPAAALAWGLGRRWLAGGLLLLVLLVCQLGHSGAEQLASALAVGAFALAALSPRLVRRGLVALVVVAGLALPWVLPPAFHVLAPAAAQVKHSGLHRVEIWDFTAKRIQERPLLGWGHSQSRFLPVTEADMSDYQRFDGAVTHSHNALLEVWVDLGLPGIVILLSLFALVAARTARLPRPLQPFALACLTAATVIACLSYSLWLGIWLESLFLAAFLFHLLPAALRHPALTALAGSRACAALDDAGQDGAGPPASSGRRPVRLLFLVTEDWYFWSHRLPTARAARDLGYQVIVATCVQQHAAAIRGEGFELAPIEPLRDLKGPLGALAALVRLVRVYRRARPDLAHHIALVPTVFGLMAARLAGVPHTLATLTGLGFVFTSPGWRSRALRLVMVPLLRELLSGPRHLTIFQNQDDLELFARTGIILPEQVRLIRGSGVDTRALQPRPEPAGPVTALFVGRMLRPKGVLEMIEAARLLRARGVAVRLVLVGIPDPRNLESVDEASLRAWQDQGLIEWWGFRDDIAAVWASAHIALLPSYREGLPKSLLEAAACGRPLIATDVPGCREIVRPGVSGLLVPARDPAALAEAIARLAADGDARRRMGAAARVLVEQQFSDQVVAAQMQECYRELLARV